MENKKESRNRPQGTRQTEGLGESPAAVNEGVWVENELYLLQEFFKSFKGFGQGFELPKTRYDRIKARIYDVQEGLRRLNLLDRY